MKRNDNRSRNSLSKKRKLNSLGVLREIIIRNDANDLVVLTKLNEPYVRIGKYIYQVEPNDSNEIDLEKYIGLTLNQYHKCQEYIIDDKIVVSEFTDTVPFLSKIEIKISTGHSINFDADKIDLEKFFFEFLSESVIIIKQKFTVVYDGYILDVLITDMGNKEIGQINDGTEIDFKHSDNITIYHNCIEINAQHLEISVTNCLDLSLVPRSINDVTKYSVVGNICLNNLTYFMGHKFPLYIHRNIMNYFIKNILEDPFPSGQIFSFKKNDFEFKILVKVVNANDNTKYKNIYKLISDNNILNIKSNTDHVIIVEDQKIATSVSFNVSGKTLYNSDQIVLIDELKEFIRKNIRIFTTNQIFKYQYQSREITFKINYVNPIFNEKTIYEIGPDTEINLDHVVNLVLIKNQDENKLKKLTLRIKKKPGLFSLLESNVGNMAEDLLKNIAKNKLPNLVAKKYQTQITYDGNEYILSVKELEFEESIKNTSNMCGLITNDTTFQFELSKKIKNCSIYKSEMMSEIIGNPIKELEKYVGGLSSELKLVVKNICLARGVMKEEFLLRKLRPVKGIIFHGPPGTGKTYLASQLGKILGCNITLMSGSEIYNKWVGGTEGNVRKIFKPAKKSWKKLGVKAPTYMVIIDEIDAMLPVRSSSSSNSVRESAVNQFLSELDGLEQFNNFICVGITNRLELIDPAAIRAGRLEIHIKIDVPNKEGRQRIFEIHTKFLKDINRLGKIDFKELVEMTDSFTGADIEGIIKTASLNSLDRLNDKKTKKEKLTDSDYLIIHDDFVKAIDFVKDTKKIGYDKNPYMYI